MQVCGEQLSALLYDNIYDTSNNINGQDGKYDSG